MKGFSNASFSPEVIQVMQQALDDAVSSLPHPASSKIVQEIAEAILRAANEGQRDPVVLRVMALMTLQLRDDRSIQIPTSASWDIDLIMTEGPSVGKLRRTVGALEEELRVRLGPGDYRVTIHQSPARMACDDSWQPAGGCRTFADPGGYSSDGALPTL